MEPCANCGRPYDSAYCPACGEKRRAPGIRLGAVVHEAVGTITHAEGPFLHTIGSFLRSPGKLTAAFVDGKRKAFVPPVRYFLFGIGYYYLVRYLLHWDPVTSAAISTSADPAANRLLEVNAWMTKHVNLLLPLLVLVLATLDRLLFPRTAFTWTERVVHYFFAVGTYLLVATTLLPLTLFFPAMVFVNFLVIIGILIWAAISLHRGSKWSVVKAVLMVPIGFWIYVVMSTIAVAIMLGVPLAEVFARPTP